ncbi:MAG: FAD:protein FMN transferase, partial [Candidatus Omnitrophica bacterium]|nr:FAD:protein FMN transferase [Candidatus Omnitrophota bacterium]
FFYLKFFITSLILSAVFLFCFFLSNQTIKYSQEHALLGTFVHIDICAARNDRTVVLIAFDKAWQRLEEINTRLNVYDEKSDIAKINASYPNPVQIYPDTYKILQLSIRYNELTQGAFDITIWPLVVLWKDAEKKNKIPSVSEIKIAQSATGNNKVKFLPQDRIQLMHPRTKIDLSAIGQGYAADEAARVLNGEGLKNFLVNTGGEIFAQGCNENGQPWTVGIKDPGQSHDMFDIIKIASGGVSTSGNYEKYYEIAQKRYSRVIDPKTGYPASKVASATVVAQNATQADILSTALCVLGSEKGSRMLGALPYPVAVMIIEQNESKAPAIYKNREYQNLAR